MRGKKKILIVDDEKPISNYLARAFSRLDFDVVAAFDGLEALEKARTEQPDIIILDLSIPKKDGLMVLKDLKASDLNAIPVVILSARDRLHEIREGLDAGAAEYICKPVFTEDLVKTVLACLK